MDLYIYFRERSAVHKGRGSRQKCLCVALCVAVYVAVCVAVYVAVCCSAVRKCRGSRQRPSFVYLMQSSEGH